MINIHPQPRYSISIDTNSRIIIVFVQKGENTPYRYKGKALSAAQLMNKMGFSHRPTCRKNYLNPALEAGLIERTIPDKPNSKNQKYRKKLK